MSKKSLAQFKKNVGRYKLVREIKKEIASYKVEPKSKGGKYLKPKANYKIEINNSPKDAPVKLHNPFRPLPSNPK